MYSFSFTKGFYPTGFFLGKVLMRHLLSVLSSKGECCEGKKSKMLFNMVDGCHVIVWLDSLIIAPSHFVRDYIVPVLPPINMGFIS